LSNNEIEQLASAVTAIESDRNLETNVSEELMQKMWFTQDISQSTAEERHSRVKKGKWLSLLLMIQ